MPILKYKWIGKIASTNQWTAIRVIKRSNKWIPMVYETEIYRKFKNNLAYGLKSTGVKLEGYHDLRIKVSLWKVRDTDNCIKPVMDAMEMAGIIPNDKFIRNIVIIRAYHPKSEQDLLEIEVFKAKPQDETWAKSDELFQ